LFQAFCGEIWAFVIAGFGVGLATGWWLWRR
jgi:hypothetical protein